MNYYLNTNRLQTCNMKVWTFARNRKENVAGVCPTQLTLILTGGARRSSQMSSLKRGLVFARAHRVPCLGIPSVNGRWNTSSSVGSVCMSPHKVPAGYAPEYYHRSITKEKQTTLKFSIQESLAQIHNFLQINLKGTSRILKLKIV